MRKTKLTTFDRKNWTHVKADDGAQSDNVCATKSKTKAGSYN